MTKFSVIGDYGDLDRERDTVVLQVLLFSLSPCLWVK